MNLGVQIDVAPDKNEATKYLKSSVVCFYAGRICFYLCANSSATLAAIEPETFIYKPQQCHIDNSRSFPSDLAQSIWHSFIIVLLPSLPVSCRLATPTLAIKGGQTTY